MALIATHAHEDYIGAIAHLWELPVSHLYDTLYPQRTGGNCEKKDSMHRLSLCRQARRPVGSVPGQMAADHAQHAGDPRSVHSHTCGQVLHTADWKIDSAPIAGEPVNPPLYQALGQSGLDAIVCDSTNATKPGHSVSESELFGSLNRIIAESPQRVVVGCFSSNVARLQTLGNVSRVSGRYLGLLGDLCIAW